MLRFLTVRMSLIALTLVTVSLVIFIITEILPAMRRRGDSGSSRRNRTSRTCARSWAWTAPLRSATCAGSGARCRGDFGESLVQKRPVVDIVLHRLWPSVYLAVFAFLVAVPSAVLAGIWAGVRADSRGDRVVSAVAMVGISLPEFVTGLLLMLLFSSTLDLLPSTSSIPRGGTPLTNPQILVLPTLTLTALLFAYVMRMTRASVIEVMESHYVRTAILKGLPMRRVLYRHVVPNAMLPTISVVAANAGWLLGGLIIVENVFAYPGLGQLLLSSILTRDTPLLQAVTLIVAGTYAAGNLLADISYALLDPRIRLT